jgi:hypothetical protein
MTKLSIRDYCWAFTAYFRGKVLRQQAYRPQNNGVFMAFRTPRGVTAKRQMLLMRLWGYRPMTMAEIPPMVVQTDRGPTPLPTPKWVDGKWDVTDSTDDWGSSGRLFLRQ